ncbi:MAG TPA: alpha-amylase family glycosyl hydrolase [Sunxiuqinia sp.]|nr:alpha-amylase family glycosyl hydrolase [Sunxiuqinia sp.]
MKNLLLPFILLFWTLTTQAQITTDPAFPVASKPVSITFNSSQDSRLGFYTGDLYAHTGVKIEGKSQWQHVIGDWNDNTVQPKLTNLGGGMYQLIISPDITTFYSVPSNETVTQLALVFRSADGKKQTNDLFVDVYPEGLTVTITNLSVLAIVKIGDPLQVNVSASEASNLAIYLDNDSITGSDSSTQLSDQIILDQIGNHWLIAQATKGGTSVRDSVLVHARGENTLESRPVGTKKGINYNSNTSVTLCLWAPYKSYVYALGDFNNWLPDEDYLMKKDGDYYWLTINNLEPGKPYIFQYLIDGSINIADPYTDQTSDPWNDQYISSSTYPNLPSYPTGKTFGIASVFETGQTPYQWQVNDFQVPDKTKMTIYELLVRDFDTQHSYQAVIDHLDYLKDLNINVLELMPVNEFEGNISWGYNPSFYFAPDKYYGPKNELKKLVDECHKRGIAVVIDLVLNHSYGQSPLVQMYWDSANNRPAANNPWYNQKSNFQNPDAQWGYDFNHDSPYTRELVDSINSYWMSQYHVDGFRFDFTKGFSNTPYGPTSWGSSFDAERISNLERMADEIWKRNSQALVIFEHLSDNPEEKILSDHGMMLWGNMNGSYINAAEGNVSNSYSDLSWGIFSQRGWDQPNLVSYMESHDEERVTYRVLTSGKSSGDYNTRTLPVALDRMKLNNVFFIPLPGPKMIWEFGERGYDISIDDPDFGGRLGEKPPHWDYLENQDRLNLFKVVSKLNYLKQTYDEFQNPTIKYSLTGAVKTYQLQKGDNYVVAVGNFDVVQQTTTVNFPKTGTWYDYFGESSFQVNSSQMNFTLAPGEYHLFSTRQFDQPHISTENTTIKLVNDIQVYPNPASDYVIVKSPSPVVDAYLYSIQGNLIKHISDAGTSPHIRLNSLKNGIYILKINTQQFSKKIKIIKN